MRTLSPALTMSAMYAQVIELPLPSARLRELEHVVRFQLLPALRAEPGFSGATNLVDEARGATLLILLWETEAEAARPLANGEAPVQQAFATLLELAGLGSCSPTIWEVTARA